MIWDNFSVCAILTSFIHSRVVVSRVDVVTLRDQILRIARFSCGFFTAMARNKEPELFYVLLCSSLMEGWAFRVEHFFDFTLLMNTVDCIYPWTHSRKTCFHVTSNVWVSGVKLSSFPTPLWSFTSRHCLKGRWLSERRPTFNDLRN